jgi:DNA-binding beta-propeller fold protein YncE
VIFSFIALGGVVLSMVLVEAKEAGPAPYRSPLDVRFSPNGQWLAVSDRTGMVLSILDAAGGGAPAGRGGPVREVALNGKPAGVCWSADGSKVYVGEYNAGTVAEVDAAGGKVLRRLPAGLRPMGVALAPKSQLLVVANTVTHDVSIIDLASGKEKARVKVPREPFFVAVTPDGSMAVVGNLLPAGNSNDPQDSAAVSLITLADGKDVADVRLPGGSSCVRQVAISPDGKYAYAVHTVGRTTLPTTQLERGWVNTNALSVIDLAAKSVLATVLLDRLSEGAANPWGVVLSKDGQTAWITLEGVHQVAKVDLGGLHALLKGETPAPEPGKTARALPEIWAEIKKDPERRKMLVNDLAALYAAGLLVRTPLAAKAPRGVDLSPDGKTLAVAMYYSGAVAMVDPQTGKVAGTVKLGPDGENDPVRRGERIFHDATYCFQHWLSCATCHPDNGRTDGLNWDLVNDGIGNPKNSRSLLWAQKTPPVMSHAVRADMEAAVVAGFRFIQFHEPQPDELEATQAYVRSLEPEPSPYLTAKGELSERAQRGKKIFESAKTGCARCHPAPLFTDLKLYDVGTRGALDHLQYKEGSIEFDTPTLVELYRTAPYLHNGEAVTLEEVFTKFNPKDQHGATRQLSKDELADLIEYLLSL